MTTTMVNGARHSLLVRDLGRRDYLPVWRAMQHYTDNRDETSPDEIWLLEHAPVFTQGQAGKAEHVLMPGDIPVVQVDRGGQVTYHGPGQLMVYTLFDIQRMGLGTRSLVQKLEQAVIDLLAGYQLGGHLREGMPGVYVHDAKIASLGLRIRRGRSYHGLAFNIAMDLEPFARINPCGYQGLAMTQLSAHCPEVTLDKVKPAIVTQIQRQLDYTNLQLVDLEPPCLNPKS
ncbi:MAG: lipoyl(octanoyl) transferase LipB [Wenzhouxiangellaceae bacterium]